jgi:protein-S-isoprenylcysteine O-methyltransferase Ste14
MGASLNPRIGSFDLKFFSEARPGLILWVLINFSFMGMQYKLHGTVTAAMILVVAMQFWYILDYYLNEPAILTTMDIAYENFGFMLAFGDLVWVPFTYSLQALFLINHLHDIPVWGIALIVAVNFAGYYIFRNVNLQKHRFRTEPDTLIWGKKPECIETEKGTKLLVSGFWAWSRHFNYIGDILMALAWSLPTLFFTPVTYFYPVYFALLLIHRERRDNRHCAVKYGKDWDRYCEKVPWRIIPRIY